MSPEQITALVTALGTFIGTIGTVYVLIKSANKPVVTAIEKNTATLETVHEQTNSNLAAVKEQLAAQTLKAEKVMDLSLETVTRQLAAAEAEINRLNAAASPPGGGS